MSEKGLLEWLGKRKEESVSVGARTHTLTILDIVTELDGAIVSMAKGQEDVAVKCMERLAICEREADRIEDKLCIDISGGELSVQEREDLIHFVRKLNNISSWAKEASLHLQLIKETGAKLSIDVWKLVEKMSSELIITVKYLLKVVEYLPVDSTETIRNIDAVNDQERIIDNLYFDAIKYLHLSDADCKSVMLMRELILSLEMAADTCKTCAEGISILMVSRRI